jgi:RNAse (barnase) inhibitor barstar
MTSLLQFFADHDRAGVYQTTMDADEIVAAAKTAGLQVFRLNLVGVCDKSGLLDRFAKVLRFPSHFGKNWDALNDCLTDLAWLSGNGLILLVTGSKNFAGENEADFYTTLTVLRAAAAHWQCQKRPFWAVIESDADAKLEIPTLLRD